MKTKFTGIKMGAIFAGLMISSFASAMTLTFDETSIEHGTIIDDEYGAYGVSIRALNNSTGPDLAVAYDTSSRAAHNTSNRDPDLTSSWSGGNIIDPSYNAGNALIVQENNWCFSNICAAPDDEGSRPSGSLFIDFDSAIASYSFDLIDIEDPELTGAKIVYRDSSQNVLGETLYSSLNEAIWGDNTYNEIGLISLLAFGTVQTLEFVMGGSGAVDNISFTSVSTVPVPGSAVILFLGLLGLVAVRRKFGHAK